MNKKPLIVVVFILSLFCLLPLKSEAASLATRFRGAILLQVESHGEAWYVHPTSLKRYYLADGTEAYKLMRQLGVGITNANLAKIQGSLTEAKKQSGKILLQVEAHGEAYYVNSDGKLYYLKDGTAAYQLMRGLGQGIKTSDLATIALGDLLAKAPVVDVSGSTYETKQVSVGNNSFAVKMITIDLATPGLKIVTDTGNDADCTNNCQAKSLADYVTASSGFAAIHGSYFCPTDYASCATSKNSYYYPVYNSRLGKMINATQLKWPTTGPLLVFDTNNKAYFFTATTDFKDVATFESKNKVKVAAAIGNQPALIHEDRNILALNSLDDKQKNTKSSRGGIGIKDNKVYLVIASGATVVDLAGVMQSLGMTEAMNLDGGGSSALYYQGAYKVGPGRSLPNAIIFKK